MSKKIAIFASGSGSNAQNIINYFHFSTELHFPVILSNKSDALVHERAKTLGVDSFTFSKESFENAEDIIRLLDHYQVEYIVLAGFLLRISDRIVQRYPNRILNIHPALLPKYGGKGMYGSYVHQAVKDAGDLQSGVTIHYINEHYDEGAIIAQYTCDLTDDDTVVTIADKVHQLEYKYYPQVIEKLWSE